MRNMMKKGSGIYGFSRACVTAFMAWGSFDKTTLAATAFENISQDFRNAPSSISSADVYLIARDRSFRQTYGESDVVRSGCRFVVKSATDLDSLINVLADAELSRVPAPEESYDARIVVRFYENSGIRTVVLGPDYANANAIGEYRLLTAAENTVISVQAKNGIERNMRHWAAQHRPLALKGCRG